MVEKSISYQIEAQFPAIYRESGRELIDLVKTYYQFLENTPNQGIYNSRRMFEYRDIDTTLSKFILFFKNKYLNDMPFNENTTRFIVKHILDLYRRRGTKEGIELFFRLFYQENSDVYYPGNDILKSSASEWRTGDYIQLYPSDNVFYSSILDKTFTYADLIGKLITGSLSKAEATLDKINFVILNNTLTPIFFLNNVKGTFAGFDEIISSFDDIPVTFGKVYGSLDRLDIDTNFDGTTGNSVGDILDCACIIGIGAKVIVDEVSENFTGEIQYTILDGGFGYTKENTLLLVSNQIIFLDDATTEFTLLEKLEDQNGNTGIVIGKRNEILGVKLDAGNEFSANSVITTIDRVIPITVDYISITPKNDSSPGNLYPETNDLSDVKLDVLENTETISLITDIISDFVNVPLDAINFNVAPALIPMSGNTDPVDINTPLDEAFDLTPFEIGSAKVFININPGADYVNDTFAVIFDPIIAAFDRYDQILTLNTTSGTFSVGDELNQGVLKGKIKATISGSNSIIVTPYSYYGFADNLPITYKGVNYSISNIEVDYSSNKYGFNGAMNTRTEFAVGKILSVSIVNSGFGYVDQSNINLRDSQGNIAARGRVNSRGQGISEGFWVSFNSHLNGYVQKPSGLEYYESGKYIRDSLFYQEYSYQIKSKLNINTYESQIKDTVHLAGTKIFGEFLYDDLADVSSTSQISIVR